MIPLTDLRRQHQELGPLVEANVLEVLREQEFILGPRVERFESAVAEFLGADAAVGVSSGSDGLVLALLDAGIGPGDEVITTPLTFMATAEAICRVGARPVFVDVEPEQLSISPGALRAALSPQVKAVIVVHLFGHVGPLEEISAICSDQGLVLIEDAAQAFGARLGERCVGTIGDYGVFSFFPAKILGAAGDGGLVVSSQERAARLRQLRVHGHLGDGEFGSIGGNFRLDAIQAAVLAAKLPSVGHFLRARREHALAYNAALFDLDEGFVLPRERVGTVSAWNYYVVRCPHPERFVAGMRQRNIMATRYYATPLHRQRCFASVCRVASLEVSERVASGLVALPLFPELTKAEREQVISAALELGQTR